jgi:hypothetical protein
VNAPSQTVEPTEGSTEDGTLEQRQAALLTSLRSETPDVAPDAPAPAAPAAAPPLAEDAARKERRARLEALSRETREAVDRKERQTASEKLARDLAAAQARAAEAEKRAAAALDRAVLKDPIKVMRLMEAEGIHADKVAEAIRESITNPDVVASRAAREAVSPEIQAMRDEIAASREQVKQLLATVAQRDAAAEEQRHTEAFVQHAAASATRAPLAAALLKHDRAEFLQIAEIASRRVHEGAGADALLDALEDVLDSDVRQVAQKYAAIYGTAQPSPATQTRRGAVQPNTVSNSLAQERGSLVEEEDLAKLPLEERARRLIRSM